METRIGRLNIIEFINRKTVRKIGVVQERNRPYRLKVEGWALSQARLRGVNTPNVFKYGRDVRGREVLLIERIHGKHLSYSTSGENDKYLFDVGRQMALLRNISTGYGWINPLSMIGSIKNWKPFIFTYVHTYGNQLIRKKVIERDYIWKVYKMIDNNDLDISSPYLVHRDIKLSNIIRDNSGKIWIIDWENAIFGDPLYDIAIFGIKYGHGNLWKNLILGYDLDVSSKKYIFYEIVGLIGIVIFYEKHQIDYRKKQKQLHELIQQLYKIF